jgi:hypothetical protein
MEVILTGMFVTNKASLIASQLESIEFSLCLFDRRKKL